MPFLRHRPTYGTGSAVDPLNGFWTDAEPSQELYNHVMPPNTWNCSTDTTNYHGAAHVGIEPAQRRGQPAHDGRSVRCIKNSISMPTWWGLGTKSNGEVIDGSSF